MKRILIALLIVLSLVGAVWWLAGFWRVEVLTAPAVTGPAVNAVTGTVRLNASIDLQIKNEGPGRLQEIKVTPGQAVRKGEVLAILESTELQALLDQRKIQWEAAQQRAQLPYSQASDIANAEQEFETLRLSAQGGMVAGSELERRARDLAKLKSYQESERITRTEAVNLLATQIRQLEAQVGRMTLVAPYDGQIAEVYAFNGDWLWSGSAVARLISMERSVELTLSEEDYFGVAKGQKATIHLASLPGQPIVGVVDWLAYTANSNTKTRAVYLKIEGEAAALAPGLGGEAVLVKDRRDNAIIIPRRALIGQQVMVVREGRIEIRRVTPGFLSLDKAEILTGLSPGELVVLENQDSLRNNQRVLVKAAQE